jgi:hypothetical protein
VAATEDRLVATLHQAGPKGLTKWDWANAAQTTDSYRCTLMPGIRKRLAKLNFVIPRPTAQNGWRYVAIHTDERAMVAGEEASITDTLTRLQSLARDTEAFRAATAKAGNVGMARFWKDVNRSVGYVADTVESQLDRVIVRIPAGAKGTSRNGRKAVGKHTS